MITHPFEPVYDRRSRVLVLGSFPSVRSRQEGFYYGHPRNRFWPVLSAVFGDPVPEGIQGRQEFLKAHGIALWDAALSCEIRGSSDLSIRRAVPTDLSPILRAAPIGRVLLNGRMAARIYLTHQGRDIDLPYIVLPSTSPANAGITLERLVCIWREALDI